MGNARATRRSLLVTGGAGFMGSNFTFHWADRYPDDHIVVLDLLTYAGRRATLEPLERRGRITFVHGDICDRSLVEAVWASHDVDTVVHFAAETHVDRSIEGAGPFVRTNVLGTQVLLDAARTAWCDAGVWRAGARFHHISTDEVYGALADGAAPFTETSPYRPGSPYAASKAAADHLVRAAGHTHGLPYTISHCANNYGPCQFPEKLVPRLIVRALQGQAMPVFGDGQQQREWIHVADHSAAVETIVRADVAGQSFNIGGGQRAPNLDVVHRLCDLLDQRFMASAALRERFPGCPASRGGACASLITHVADRPGHDRRYALDATKIAATIGFAPRESFETGLAETVDWYVGHEAWWRR